MFHTAGFDQADRASSTQLNTPHTNRNAKSIGDASHNNQYNSVDLQELSLNK